MTFFLSPIITSHIIDYVDVHRTYESRTNDSVIYCSLTEYTAVSGRQVAIFHIK